MRIARCRMPSISLSVFFVISFIDENLAINYLKELFVVTVADFPNQYILRIRNSRNCAQLAPIKISLVRWLLLLSVCLMCGAELPPEGGSMERGLLHVQIFYDVVVHYFIFDNYHSDSFRDGENVDALCSRINAFKYIYIFLYLGRLLVCLFNEEKLGSHSYRFHRPPLKKGSLMQYATLVPS